MKICSRINICISYLLILLSGIWFMFVIMINNRSDDPRISSLNLMTPISQQFSEGIYLRKIQLNEQYMDLALNRNRQESVLNMFELIEIMNDNSPNILGDEVILIVSVTNQKLDLSSIKFAEYLYNKGHGMVGTGNINGEKSSASKGNSNNNNSNNNNSNNNDNKQELLSNKQSQAINRQIYSSSHAEHNSQDSAFSTPTTQTKQIPIYILRQTQPVLLNNEKNLISYRQQILSTLNYFVKILDIKKLSLLSFQIGALLTLYSLANQNNPKLFHSLNKVVLINPFALDIKIFHSPPIAFVENQIKPAILQSDQKFNLFNNLRLIIISTTRTVFQQSPIAQQYFSFGYKKVNFDQSSTMTENSESQTDMSGLNTIYRFNNTFTISTRAMSNVFCFFDKQIYFFYEPFVSLLSKFFVEDSKKQFSYDQMEYYFHYKELPEVKQLSERTKRKYISKCIDFSLQNYHYGGDTFGGQGKQHQQCIRLLRKQSIYFQDSSILLYSKQKFQVYGQNFQKLYPFESKTTYMVYHIQRVNQFRRLFILNRKSALIHMKIAPIFMPLTNPIVSFQYQSNNYPISADLSQLSFQNLTNFQVIRTCEPANLIFPLHFAKMARFGQHSLLFNKDNNQRNCYTEYDNYDFYPDWFMLNWNILRNIMIFTFFVSHVLGKGLAERFYTQNMINQAIVWVNTGSLLLFENFIILSTLCVIETIINYLMIGMQYFKNVRKIILNFIWVPVALEIASIYYPFLPSSWKVLFLLIGLCTSKHNIFLIAIKLCFMIDSIRFDTGNIKGIIAICMWTYVGAFEKQAVINHNNRNNELKKKILDMCFLFSIGVCINEDGSVIDEIINAYIVMQTILYINYRYF